MKNNMVLKAAVLGALGLVSAQAMATGLVNMPSTGFTVGSNTSAYTLCNTTGNFGAEDATAPTTASNNTCATFPANANTAPEASFTLVTSVNRNESRHIHQWHQCYAWHGDGPHLAQVVH